MMPAKLKRIVVAVIVACTATVLVLVTLTRGSDGSVMADDRVETPAADEYVVIAWNDLGMHCYNQDFSHLALLPPYNTLWAQVIRVGDPPSLITSGITVTYFFTDNTYSVGKSNFWDYEQDLFNVDLPPNIGLTGRGLSGVMEAEHDHFVAEGIPLTEYRDSNLDTPYPYMLATVVVEDAATGIELARVHPVAPVSTEMHCGNCHYDGGVEDIATGNVETNILTVHDMENMDDYPPGHEGSLIDRQPILCAECHPSVALGAAGVPGMPAVSTAMHSAHTGEVPDSRVGCYMCHPGPETQCQRDIMTVEFGIECTDCHGGMQQVAQNPEPWLNEPRCDDLACHGPEFAQDNPLYRLSKEHGGIYCEGCHDSPHAIAESREPNDSIKFIELQGHAGTLRDCTVCHLAAPSDPGPHGITEPSEYNLSFAPDYSRMVDPGGTTTYVHVLQNSGNQGDTYDITWDSSQSWATGISMGGSPVVHPVTLLPAESVEVVVTVTVPITATGPGLSETTTVTATSRSETGLMATVTDVTTVRFAWIYLPTVFSDSP